MLRYKPNSDSFTMEELCEYCDTWFPFPVNYHHTSVECDENVEADRSDSS